MFTDPIRTLLLALIVTAFVQVAKMCIPLLNGWGALAANLLLTAAGFAAVFRVEPTWSTLAAYLTVALTAAGIHGTATKISDHPSPHHNPTPSGTPAQNYRAKVD